MLFTWIFFISDTKLHNVCSLKRNQLKTGTNTSPHTHTQQTHKTELKRPFQWILICFIVFVAVLGQKVRTTDFSVYKEIRNENKCSDNFSRFSLQLRFLALFICILFWILMFVLRFSLCGVFFFSFLFRSFWYWRIFFMFEGILVFVSTSSDQPISSSTKCHPLWLPHHGIFPRFEQLWQGKCKEI